MTVCFVTGTDTGVGKTVVTAALTVILRARRKNVAVVKPAQTGVWPGEPGDVDEVRRLAGPVDAREGIRLPDPLAPDRAALVAGVELPGLGDQRDLVLAAAASHDTVLVEGAGGVTVNLGQAFSLLDIAGQICQAGPPVTWIVVARAGLGTLNHSNLTVRAIQQRGSPCTASSSVPGRPNPGQPSCTTATTSPPTPAYPSSEPSPRVPPPSRRQTSRPAHPAGSRPIADPLHA